MMSQMWIETTNDELYGIWQQMMDIALKYNPKNVVENKQNTKSLIEQIMYKFSTIIPKAKYHQTPLELSKYPLATLCVEEMDHFTYIILKCYQTNIILKLCFNIMKYLIIV